MTPPPSPEDELGPRHDALTHGRSEADASRTSASQLAPWTALQLGLPTLALRNPPVPRGRAPVGPEAGHVGSAAPVVPAGLESPRVHHGAHAPHLAWLRPHLGAATAPLPAYRARLTIRLAADVTPALGDWALLLAAHLDGKAGPGPHGSPCLQGAPQPGASYLSLASADVVASAAGRLGVAAAERCLEPRQSLARRLGHFSVALACQAPGGAGTADLVRRWVAGGDPTALARLQRLGGAPVADAARHALLQLPQWRWHFRAQPYRLVQAVPRTSFLVVEGASGKQVRVHLGWLFDELHLRPTAEDLGAETVTFTGPSYLGVRLALSRSELRKKRLQAPHVTDLYAFSEASRDLTSLGAIGG